IFESRRLRRPRRSTPCVQTRVRCTTCSISRRFRRAGRPMTLELYGHPFSSYTWKTLIPLWANEMSFEYHKVFEDPDASARLATVWPLMKFPVLVDEGEVIAEASCIIEHLQAHHPGPNVWIPEGELGRRVRFLDRFFDLHVQGN